MFFTKAFPGCLSRLTETSRNIVDLPIENWSDISICRNSGEDKIENANSMWEKVILIKVFLHLQDEINAAGAMSVSRPWENAHWLHYFAEMEW